MIIKYQEKNIEVEQMNKNFIAPFYVCEGKKN